MKRIKLRKKANILLIGVLSLMTTVVNAEDVQEGVDITVQVNNIDRTKPGNILVMLYAKNGFPKDHTKALKIEVIPAVAEQISVDFSSVPAEFAIKILHDEDKTGEVTKNWTGIIPAEGLGFSNGAVLRFAPPSFNKAKLTLSKVFSPLSIDIIYP
jgi:uncharacterized protein (DUF2141 family)